MLVEVWSDVVCPWCYIGLTRFHKALVNFEHKDQVQVVHRAFQLNPDAPFDEQRLTLEVLAEKYGGGIEGVRQMTKQVTEVAASDGLEFHLDNTLSGNTLNAHRLLVSLENPDDQYELLNAMFASYFTDSKSLFDTESLLEIVESAGLDKQWAFEILDSESAYGEVVSDQATAQSLGANGVPFFVVDRKFDISGTQPTEVFEQALAQAWETTSN
jgi:predicted DsbA family dithiol-disulfide isomerase